MFITQLYKHFQEVGFPYMASDERFADDTIFIFMEADFRFYERDCLTPEQWLPLVVGTEHSTAPYNFDEERSARGELFKECRPPPGPKLKCRKEQVAAHGVHHAALAKNVGIFRQMLEPRLPSAPYDNDVSPELHDMVATMNIAARWGVGDVCWFSWNAGEPGKKAKKPSALGFGSQCVGFTRHGAQFLLEEMQREKTRAFRFVDEVEAAGSDGGRDELHRCELCGATHRRVYAPCFEKQNRSRPPCMLERILGT